MHESYCISFDSKKKHDCYVYTKHVPLDLIPRNLEHYLGVTILRLTQIYH